MSERELRQIPLTALFIAAAVFLPQLFHVFGLGAIFLPMFLPVMAGAMLLSWKFALLLGIVSPIISWAITGMPAMVPPILPVVIIELASTAVIISWLRVHRKKSVWLALITGIVWDRFLLFILVSFILPVFGVSHPLFTIGFVAGGFPGIILQLLVIPQLIPVILKRYPEYEQ